MKILRDPLSIAVLMLVVLTGTAFGLKKADVDGSTGVIGRVSQAPGDLAKTSIGDHSFWTIGGVYFADDDWGIPVSSGGGGSVPGVDYGPPMTAPTVIIESTTDCDMVVRSEGWSWQVNQPFLQGHDHYVDNVCDIDTFATGYNPPGGTVAPAPSYITTTWVDEQGLTHSVHTRKKTSETLEATMHRHQQWLAAAMEVWPPAPTQG